MKYTVIGLFKDRADTKKAVDKLQSKGIDKSHIDVSPYRTEGEYAGDDYDYEKNEKNEGFWNWLFGSDSHDRERYSRAGARSHVVTVYTKDRSEAVRSSEILDESGAQDVNDFNKTKRTSGDRPARTTGTATKPTADTTTKPTNEKGSVEVVKEDIDVGKKEVQDGGVRLKSRIVEKPVEEDVRLRDERVYVKRKPVNKSASERDFKEGTVEMRESHEEPVVKKKAKVVEEVGLEKDVHHKDKKVKDTVRETEVDVEKDGRREDRNTR